METTNHPISAIQAAHVSKTFVNSDPPCQALDDITFSIPCGEVVGLLGESGSGKTTLLKLIAGSIQPTHGGMTVHRQRQTGEVRQEPACHLSLAGETVFDPQQSIHEYYAQAPQVDLGLLDQALRTFGIIARADEKVECLPQTAIFRAALAGAFSSPAPVLLIDELPGFDREAAQALSRWLPDRVHATDQTVIAATRDPGVTLALCDRLLVLHKGYLTLDCSLSELIPQASAREYEFRLRGCLDPSRSEWFGSFRIRDDGRDTLLVGEVFDQSHLHGILARIRDLGMTIESFRRIYPDAEQILRDAMTRSPRQ